MTEHEIFRISYKYKCITHYADVKSIEVNDAVKDEIWEYGKRLFSLEPLVMEMRYWSGILQVV